MADVKPGHCRLYIAFRRRNYYPSKFVPDWVRKEVSVRCERQRRHVIMCVDGVNRILKFVYISIAQLMRGPCNPSLVVIAYHGSQTDCLPSFLTQRWQRRFSARKGSGHARAWHGSVCTTCCRLATSHCRKSRGLVRTGLFIVAFFNRRT